MLTTILSFCYVWNVLLDPKIWNDIKCNIKSSRLRFRFVQLRCATQSWVNCVAISQLGKMVLRFIFPTSGPEHANFRLAYVNIVIWGYSTASRKFYDVSPISNLFMPILPKSLFTQRIYNSSNTSKKFPTWRMDWYYIEPDSWILISSTLEDAR